MNYVTSARAAKEFVNHLKRFDIIGLDIETTGTDPYQHRLRLISLCGIDDIADKAFCAVFDVKEIGGIPDEVVEILTDPNILKVAHNAVFDLKFLMYSGVAAEPVWDTMAAEHVISGGTKFPPDLALDAVVQRRFGVKIDKSLQKSDWAGELTEAQIEYAAADAEWVARIYLKQRREADPYQRVIDLENRILLPVAWMVLAGVRLDAERFRTQAEHVRHQADELARRWAELAAKYVTRRTLFGEAAVNIRSTRQVQAVLRAAGIGVESTDSEFLVHYRGHPLVDLLLEYRFYEKRRSTYGVNLLEYINPVTGRIHPEWWPLRAASGRMACSSPNLQNIPRDSGLRACIRAEPGNKLIKADYSQIELRIAAELSGDARMVESFRRGEDLHALTVREILGQSEVTPQARQLSKAINFGLIYGMGAERLRQYVFQSFGISLTTDQAAELRRRFFQTYPAIADWHRKIGRQKEVCSVLGRPRRFDLPQFSEQVNHPVQGTGADGLKNALAILWQTRHLVPGAVPVLAVHDEIVVEAPAGEAQKAAAWLKFAMLAGMAEFLRRVPVEVEVKISDTWG